MVERMHLEKEYDQNNTPETPIQVLANEYKIGKVLSLKSQTAATVRVKGCSQFLHC